MFAFCVPTTTTPTRRDTRGILARDRYESRLKGVMCVSLAIPILHASGFSWDEALVLVVAILAVPAISFFTGRLGKRKATQPPAERRRRRSETASDDAPSDSSSSE
jgi:hypothetical protein